MTYHPPTDPNQPPQWGPSEPASSAWQGGQSPPVSGPGWAGGSMPVSGQPVSGYPVGGYPAAVPPPPPRRSRGLLWTMVSVCVVLALAFAGTAYYFFFAGADPESVVTEYTESAIDGDYAHAQTLACADASDGVRFNLTAEEMDQVRMWFSDKAMNWSVRKSATSGSNATVIGDVRLMLPHYDKPIDMRWDYKLERRSGEWRVCAIQMMTVVGSAFAPGDCVIEQGFDVVAAGCNEANALSITLEVYEPKDCPDETTSKVENDRQRILCAAPR